MKKKSLSLGTKGFTLVEVLVTVAILSFGIVTIYEALFISLDTFGFYSNYLDTQDFLGEKISEVQEQLIKTPVLDENQTSGKIVRDGKAYHWSMAIIPVDEGQKLYEIDATLSWKQGGKWAKISRMTYLMPPQLKEYNEENFI